MFLIFLYEKLELKYPVEYHVDGDAVPLLDALGLEDVGELADLLVQLRVRHLALVARVVPLPEEGSLGQEGPFTYDVHSPLLSSQLNMLLEI